ncbi:hypothetical protein [Urbifossiella limnaea]|uniref:Putative subtilase-type serine protease n=1 Tax=Urbifossiella limnaea TaxID=2528023 RepID=A0A517XMB2_9BACT|nr:hypothetical protein [Urbifossiella limnaea]QDU18641.1 putative subtilase-type serine protease precursor [Urbifossiella limnaea]
MRRLVSGTVVAAATVVLFGTVAGQPPPGLPSPRVNTAFPTGAKLGTSVEVTVTGADLDDPTGLYFSHPGIKAEYVEPPEPVDPKKKDEKKDTTPKKGKKGAGPAGGPHKFKVSVAADVPPGTYDVRAVGKYGVSNPRAFVVGELPEVAEKEPNNDVPEAQKVEIGTTVVGTIGGNADVDYTVFAGKAGQKVVIAVQASSIDGKANPMFEVIDAAGRKLAQNRNYRDNNALTDLVLPADGDYLVRLFEYTYIGGSPDHTYRLTISSAPWVDYVFPAAVEFGKPAQVTVYGRNLPGGQPSGFVLDGRPLEKLAVTITPPADAAAALRLAVRESTPPLAALQDGFEYRLKGPGGSSNAVPVYFTREKLVPRKNAAATKAEAAEALPTPCEVAGMVEKRGERHWYSFDAKKGVPVQLELTAERNGSPTDFYFSVHNPQAKNDMMGPEQDDDADLLHPTEFYTRTSDPPPYRFVPPTDGKYLVAVGCRESNAITGPSTAYRLRVGPPRPDFRVVARTYTKSYQTGSAGRQDGSEAIEVYVHRMDGFTGEVAVTAEGLPAGVTTKGTTIGGGARWGVMVLNVAANAAPSLAEIKVKATATVDGKQVVREARPATVTWGIPNPQGNNTPILGRLAQSLVIAVRPEKAFFKLAADPAGATIKTGGKDEKVSGPIFLKQGEKLTLPVKVTWVHPEKANVTVAADPVGPGQQQVPFAVTAGTQPTKDKAEGVVTIDVKANAFPGKYAVALRGESPVPFTRDAAKDKGKATPAVSFADPVEFTVLPTSLVKVTPGQLPNNTAKLNSKAELLLKLERQYDYAGEFKVKFTAPMGLTGVTADEVTVPAGKGDEAKLILRIGDGAKAGAVNNAIVTVTGRYAGKDVVTETKVNFNVAK